jgi:hypothetical protein
VPVLHHVIEDRELNVGLDAGQVEPVVRLLQPDRLQEVDGHGAIRRRGPPLLLRVLITSPTAGACTRKRDASSVPGSATASTL